MASKREERQQETHFKVMRLLQDDPSISTREIARQIGISNGAAYYCVTALIEKGFVKLKNFTQSKAKANYLYELTPRGIREKTVLTVQFLERKRHEYNDLRDEIERLENEIAIEGKIYPRTIEIDLMQIENLNCFKAYDVRGKIGDEINEDIAYRIGRSVAQSLDAKIVALGFDARETSPSLAKATAKGVCQAGADVLQLGLVGTEEIYSAVSEFNAGAGIEITASHNPIDYNGMKIVKHSSMPLLQNDLAKIKNLVKDGKFFTNGHIGSVIDVKIKAREAYIAKILRFIDLKALRPLKIAINSGNGAAGPAIDSLKKALEKRGVKTNFVYLNHNPDSSFPNGIPNPLLEENRSSTANAVVSEKADFGVAFDGDFDRCFFFDHFGKFIPGEYVVGLLAEVFLNREKEATIIHDPRVIWNHWT